MIRVKFQVVTVRYEIHADLYGSITKDTITLKMV